jgi:hypothetical protein
MKKILIPALLIVSAAVVTALAPCLPGAVDLPYPSFATASGAVTIHSLADSLLWDAFGAFVTNALEPCASGTTKLIPSPASDPTVSLFGLVIVQLVLKGALAPAPAQNSIDACESVSISPCFVRRIVEREIATVRVGLDVAPPRSTRAPQGDITMKFLSTYKCAERNTPPSQEEMAKMGKMVEDWMKSGKLVSTEGCLPSATGARVRIADGQTIVKDGPFTEAKEVVGGFAILRANSKQEAVEYVKEFLQFMGEGECELRQLFDAGDMVQAQGAAKA